MAPGGAAAPVEQTGMSTKKKVVILAGAAALYYLYKRHKVPAEEATDCSHPSGRRPRIRAQAQAAAAARPCLAT